jgi:hypothetical protein
VEPGTVDVLVDGGGGGARSGSPVKAFKAAVTGPAKKAAAKKARRK